MEQLVILIIIGLISLANWVMQKAAEKREEAKSRRVEKREVKRETRRNIYTQPSPSAPPVARRRAPERDPFKDLMDALGLPADEAPPSPVLPEPVYIEEEEFSSMEEAAPPQLPKPSAPKWQAPARPKRPDRKTAALASAFAASGQKTPSASHRGTNLRDLLAGRESQRKAVILAEILGTPRGLAAPADLMTRGHL